MTSRPDPNRPRQAQEQRLLEAVLALGTEAERRSFLDSLADMELRQRLAELIAVGAEADSFFRSPPVQHPVSQDLTATVTVPPSEAPARVIGRYKLLEIIGEGGFGEVWMAEQREPVKRRVALKVIKLGMDSRQIVARFEAERQALAMMDHPNIAKIHDAGTTEAGRPYFVMELVRGVKLTEYCDQNQLPTKQRLDLFILVCQAIQHAHQKGIIHRDIKPSNILVTVNDGVPVPKVIDFGIAKATQQELTDKTVFTQFQQFIGTPAYISPEQAEMSSLDIDTRADIYSLGVLLYELLVGQTPFDAGEMMKGGLDALRKIIREREPQRPSTRLNTMPGDARTTAGKRRQTDAVKLVHQLEGDLDWIVMKCLEKDRARRYETANGLAADLKRHLANEPVTARPPSVGYRLQKAFRRNKLVFTAATVVVIALVVGITVSTRQTFKALGAQKEAEKARQGEALQRQGAEQKRAEAEAERQRANLQATNAIVSQEHSRRLLYAADMNLAQQALNQNNLSRALRLLDRHRPKAGEEDLRGWEWRYLWQQCRSDAFHQLTKRSTRSQSVSFSPDGTQLAVGFRGDRNEIWDVGRRVLLKEIGRMGLGQGKVAFSPRANLLAAEGKQGGLTLHDLSTGRETKLLPEDGNLIRQLTFTHDGSCLVAFTFGKGRSPSAIVFDVKQGVPVATNLTSGANFITGTASMSSDRKRFYVSHRNRDTQLLTVKCLEPGTGTELWSADLGEDYGVSAMALSPDDKVLVTAVGFASDRIRVWDAVTGKPVAELTGHTGWVGEVSFSRDGRWLVSASADQTLRLWDTSRWTEARVFRGHEDEVAAVAFSPDGKMLASGAKDGVILLWDLSDRQSPYGHRLLPDRISVVAEYAPGLAIAADDQGKKPVRIRLEDLSESGVPVGNDLSMAFTYLPPNYFGYYEQTNVLRIMEYRDTGREVFRDTVGPGLVCTPGSTMPSLAWSEAHRLLAWSEVSRKVQVASASQPDRRWQWTSELRRPKPRIFSPDGRLLVLTSPLAPPAIGADGRIMRLPEHTGGIQGLEIREVATGKLVLRSEIQMIMSGDIPEHRAPVKFADNGRRLVMGTMRGPDMHVLFWDVTRPELPPKRFTERNTLSDLSVSPDGRWVAVGSQAGIAVVYDAASMERRYELPGSMQAVFSVTFSPDSRTLATGAGGRESIKLWQVSTGQELLTLASKKSLLMDLAFAEDGNTILLGRFQGPRTWQMWRAPSWEVITAAEAKAPASRISVRPDSEEEK